MPMLLTHEPTGLLMWEVGLDCTRPSRTMSSQCRRSGRHGPFGGRSTGTVAGPRARRPDAAVCTLSCACCGVARCGVARCGVCTLGCAPSTVQSRPKRQDQLHHQASRSSSTRDCTVHGAACRRWITSSTKVLAQVTRTRCDRPEPAERGGVTTQAPRAVAGRAPSRRPVARPSRRWPHRSTLRRQRGQQPRPDARPDTPRGMSWGRSRPVHE